MSHFNEDKLSEAIISDIKTHHVVEELVDHLRLAVQNFNFKALNRLTLIHSVEFVLELVKNPWHRSGVSLNIVDFKNPAFKKLNF